MCVWLRVWWGWGFSACVIRWSLLYIPHRGIKGVFPLKKQQRTKAPLTRQCVYVRMPVHACVCWGKGGLAAQVLDPLNSPQLWPTTSEAWQCLVCACKDNISFGPSQKLKAGLLFSHWRAFSDIFTMLSASSVCLCFPFVAFSESHIFGKVFRGLFSSALFPGTAGSSFPCATVNLSN